MDSQFLWGLSYDLPVVGVLLWQRSHFVCIGDRDREIRVFARLGKVCCWLIDRSRLLEIPTASFVFHRLCFEKSLLIACLHSE